MNQYKFTSQYVVVLARITLFAVVLLLGHDVAIAASSHGAEVAPASHSHHALMAEQCTLIESSAPDAVPVPSTDFAVFTGVGVVLHFEPEVVSNPAFEAPAPDPAKLRALLQVYLN